MNYPAKLTETILHGWEINNKVNIILLKSLPLEIWQLKIPGYQRKTIQMMCAHLHNCRCYYIKNLGRKWNLSAPESVDNQDVSIKVLISSLKKSASSMALLLKTGLEQEDKLPGFPLGAYHFMQYMTSHEAHHRGQLLMAVRQLGYAVPAKVSGQLWQWNHL